MVEMKQARPFNFVLPEDGKYYFLYLNLDCCADLGCFFITAFRLLCPPAIIMCISVRVTRVNFELGHFIQSTRVDFLRSRRCLVLIFITTQLFLDMFTLNPSRQSPD